MNISLRTCSSFENFSQIWKCQYKYINIKKTWKNVFTELATIQHCIISFILQMKVSFDRYIQMLFLVDTHIWIDVPFLSSVYYTFQPAHSRKLKNEDVLSNRDWTCMPYCRRNHHLIWYALVCSFTSCGIRWWEGERKGSTDLDPYRRENFSFFFFKFSWVHWSIGIIETVYKTKQKVTHLLQIQTSTHIWSNEDKSIWYRLYNCVTLRNCFWRQKCWFFSGLLIGI